MTLGRGRIKYRITAVFGCTIRMVRISDDVQTTRPRTVSASQLTLRERRSDSYLSLRLAWQDALAESLRNPDPANDQRAHQAYAAVRAAARNGRRPTGEIG